MRPYLTAALLAAVLAAVSACGDGYGTSSPNPGTPTPLPPDTITIDVIGIRGGQSFSPNPATIAAGRTVVWHNTDSIPHHVVLDDGELDTGNIAPGGYSAPMTLIGPGPYHCSIHPEMVGRIVSTPGT